MAKKNTAKKAAKKIKAENKANVTVEELESPVVEETVQEEPEVEVMNGDPAVVIPTEEVETFEDEPADEEPMVDEPVEVEPEVQEEEAPAVEEKITPKKNVIKHMFGYIWNGQEMDY
jgi:hypothetical protein